MFVYKNVWYMFVLCASSLNVCIQLTLMAATSVTEQEVIRGLQRSNCLEPEQGKNFYYYIP